MSLLGLLVFTCEISRAQSLVEHIIAPQATDPAIDVALDDHYAWLDTAASTNHQLFVYLPGTDGVPANALLVQQLAAQLGYHVVGLMYPDSVPIQASCVSQPDPSACSYATRLELQTGMAVPGSLENINVPNSIDNRLTKLLQYLDGTYPNEDWSQFLADGNPKWSRIAFGGISQGGGQSAFIAMLRVVSRVVMFSAPVEGYGGSPPAWEFTHATPSDRYWGLAHDQDPAYTNGHIPAGWTAFGMDAFGPLTQVELSAPPYGFTHMLFTDLRPQRGGYKNAHASTVIDFYTPLDEDHNPALAPAWRYMLSAGIND